MHIAKDTDAAEGRRITGLLADCANGNQVARERLVPIVYEELRRLERDYMRSERASRSANSASLLARAR